MDTISSDLLARIQNPLQTIDNNANPQMKVISQRYAKYINKGSFLTPRTVRTGNSLGRLDITVRREDKTLEPSEYVMLYIEDGYAKVATLPYVHTPDELFQYQYTIGPATDVACDFDGRFKYITNHTELYFDTSTQWSLETFGEPYFAIINDGKVIIYHDGEVPLILVDANVTKVSVLRGWKGITDVLDDQGLVCTYVKTDGKAYYQNYCEQEDGSYIWDYEREIIELGSPITDLSVFRTADYRMGFVVEKEGIISWVITHRNWSGMAIGPENLASNTEVTLCVTEINYYDGQETEYIHLGIGATIATLYGLSPIILSSENYANGEGDYGYLIRVIFDELVFGTTGNEYQFAITDAFDTILHSTSIINNGKELLVTFPNLNNVTNPVTLSYTPGTVMGEVVSLEACSISINLTGLVPYYTPPPIVLTIENIIDWIEVT